MEEKDSENQIVESSSKEQYCCCFVKDILEETKKSNRRTQQSKRERERERERKLPATRIIIATTITAIIMCRLLEKGKEIRIVCCIDLTFCACLRFLSTRAYFSFLKHA
jgi:hypothetical protein